MLVEALRRIELYCPACRTFDNGIVQHELTLRTAEVWGDFVITGDLECPGCGKNYPVVDGVPCLTRAVNSPRSLIDQYLDSQYGNTNGSYWAEVDAAPLRGGIHLDAGCGTGRNTFTRGNSAFAVGIDANFDYLKEAARFQREGRVIYAKRRRALSEETIESRFRVTDNVLFVLADVHNPPFRMEAFDSISALNVIDSVKFPLIALGQMDAMLVKHGQILITSPYVWTKEISDHWLETREIDPHSYVLQLLKGKQIPECGFNYTITRERTGINWHIRRQDSMQFHYRVDLIEAEKQ